MSAVLTGYVYRNNEIPSYTKQDLHRYAAEKRWRVETGGIIISIQNNNININTDERTRNILTAAFIKASADSSYTIKNWKIDSNNYIILSSQDIINIANLIEHHVQKCFDINNEIDNKIENNNITTINEIENYNWNIV